MSNVLLGIIGVILFIGLALAGALILGDEFRSASIDSKAAAVVQTMSQVAAAVSMSNLRTGSPRRSEGVTASSTLIPRFLKTAPINPVNSANGVVVTEAGGGVNNDVATTVGILLGPQADKTARAVCESIQRQSGQIAGDAAFDGTIRSLALDQLPATYGCVFNGTNYYGFQRI